jgi:hypothetical protein
MQGRQVFGENMFLMLLLVASCLDYWLWPYEPPLAPRDALLG